VALSSELLPIMNNGEWNDFDHVITDDEFWFYFEYLDEAIEVQSRDEVPERIQQNFDTEKCLISIIWPVNGIHRL
jgi:hypothetical protein